MPRLRDFEQHLQDTVRRIRAYAPQLRWFGPGGVVLGLAQAIASAAYRADQAAATLWQRRSLLAASGEALAQVAGEWGAERGPARRAIVYGVPLPRSARLWSLSGALVEVPAGEGSAFAIGWSVRVAQVDGSASDVREIVGVNLGAGFNGGDVLELDAPPLGTFVVADGVRVIVRHTVPVGTRVLGVDGSAFVTTAEVTTGDGTAAVSTVETGLSLAAGVWCRATERGSASMIEALSLENQDPASAAIVGWYNPEPARYGADAEPDVELRYRAAHGSQHPAQETRAWLEDLARRADSRVLRAIYAGPAALRTMRVGLLQRDGAPLSTNQRNTLTAYIQARVRSHLLVELVDVPLTAVVVEAEVQIEDDAELLAVWRDTARRLAEYLDWRTWAEGEPVDNAALLAIVRRTPGVRALSTETFQPSADVPVTSFPALVSLALRDIATGQVLNVTLTQDY